MISVVLIMLSDFENVSAETFGEHFKDKDVFFCTLGTTRRAAGSAVSLSIRRQLVLVSLSPFKHQHQHDPSLQSPCISIILLLSYYPLSMYPLLSFHHNKMLRKLKPNNKN